MSKNRLNDELGFGSKATKQKTRIINPDGSFNVHRIGMSKWKSFSVYHYLLTISWGRFNSIVLVYFFLVNFLFAMLYYVAGIDGLRGVEGQTPFDQFLEAFFFSTQTLSTVGFGRISPGGHLVSSIAAIESLVGLLGFAIVTGLLYGRFSRPQAHILFSKNAIIAPFQNKTAFQFRIVNKMRNSQITGMEASITVAKFETENGVKIKRFHAMELQVSKINFFPLMWTINHPISETSPISGMTYNDLKQAQAEFLIILNGYDDTFSQTVNKRYSYTIDEVVCGAKFTNPFSENEKGETVQDVSKINDIEVAILPNI
jgi:inward rectifier potassium channel